MGASTVRQTCAQNGTSSRDRQPLARGGPSLAKDAMESEGERMGRLVEGKWSTEWYKSDDKGRFVRGETAFRERVTADGSTPYAAEAGRYHLYVSYACP